MAHRRPLKADRAGDVTVFAGNATEMRHARRRDRDFIRLAHALRGLEYRIYQDRADWDAVLAFKEFEHRIDLPHVAGAGDLGQHHAVEFLTDDRVEIGPRQPGFEIVDAHEYRLAIL